MNLQGVCALVPILPLLKPKNKISLQWNYVFPLLINPIVAGGKRHVLALKSLPVLCQSSDTLRKHAYSNILKFLPRKNENFQIKKFLIFIHFCSKHRLWVLVRNASPRRFLQVPTIYVLSRNKKNNVYPCKPQFYYIKVGFTGVTII